MNLKKGIFAATIIVVIATTWLVVGTLNNNGLLASTDGDPRSDKGCEQVIRNEGEQNERTEPEGVFHGHDMPDAQRHPGADNAREGAERAVGECLD